MSDSVVLEGQTGDPGDSEHSEGPSADLIAYVYPLDGTELEHGWQEFEAPIQRQYWREMGTCLTGEGYGAVGDAMMIAEPVFPSAIWRFPRLRHLRDSGLVPASSSMALELGGWIGTPVRSVDDPFVEFLRGFPEFEILPTVDAANEFLNAYRNVCVPAVQPPAAFGSAMELRLRWYELVDEVFGRPELEAPVGELFDCLERNLNGGRTIEDQDGAVAAVDAVLFSDDEELLLRGGQAYADCMEPFIEARRPILAAERERLVQEKFGALLAMEGLFDALLEE